jgi:two-component system sensor histidine kinase KdpD
MSAGVGNFRMLQEAHTLLKNGIDVKMGLETHNGKKHELLGVYRSFLSEPLL